MTLTRKISGFTLIGASLGLSVLSGFTSWAGVTHMLPGIPYIGMLGFVIAVALVALGVGVSSEISTSRWGGALVLGVLLAGIALADRQTNFISFQSQVNAADQIAADRNKAYSTAVEALGKIELEIVRLTDHQTKMQARDSDGVKLAQSLLVSLGYDIGKHGEDGIYGGDTEKAMTAYGAVVREQLVMLKADERAYTATVSGGEVVSEAAFDMQQASLYATLITLFSLILSFAGGYLANGAQTDEQALDELETITEEFEADILDLAQWLDTRAA